MDFFKMNQLPISERIEVPRDQLSEEQVGFYLDNGYLIVENVLSREEIAELHEDLLKTARGGYPCETLRPLPSDITDEEALQNILCIHQPHHISPVALKYVKDKKVVGRVSQLAGAHVPFWDGSTKCFQSLFFVKPPGFPGQAWHQDEGYVPTRDGSMCGAWIAMDDATVANGCLHVIPGSHTTRFLWPQKPDENPEEYDLSPMSYGFDESGQVPAEVRAGGIVFFNGYILHRSPKNRSQTYRRACVNHYTNAWTLIPRGDRQEGEKGFADRRDVVLTSGVDPYYWRGYKEGVQDVWLRPAVPGEFIKKSADKYAEVPQGGGVKVESA